MKDIMTEDALCCQVRTECSGSTKDRVTNLDSEKAKKASQ